MTIVLRATHSLPPSPAKKVHTQALRTLSSRTSLHSKASKISDFASPSYREVGAITDPPLRIQPERSSNTNPSRYSIPIKPTKAAQESIEKFNLRYQQTQNDPIRPITPPPVERSVSPTGFPPNAPNPMHAVRDETGNIIDWFPQNHIDPTPLPGGRHAVYDRPSNSSGEKQIIAYTIARSLHPQSFYKPMEHAQINTHLNFPPHPQQTFINITAGIAESHNAVLNPFGETLGEIPTTRIRTYATNTAYITDVSGHQEGIKLRSVNTIPATQLYLQPYNRLYLISTVVGTN